MFQFCNVLFPHFWRPNSWLCIMQPGTPFSNHESWFDYWMDRYFLIDDAYIASISGIPILHQRHVQLFGTEVRPLSAILFSEWCRTAGRVLMSQLLSISCVLWKKDHPIKWIWRSSDFRSELDKRIFARAGARTLDRPVKSRTLYRLSYPGNYISN